MSTGADLLALIREHAHHPATAREIARILRVPREERSSFRRRLKALVAEGALLLIRGSRYGLPEKMDLVVGRLTGNPGGFGFVVPERDAPGISAAAWASPTTSASNHVLSSSVLSCLSLIHI